ncbi:complement C1q and tumor necrosis factor-related protein 9-like [Leuresthes tenuis]|uniref:complement C1q and tumor necrosis factor-related protein 9-like n=1 Tax=Leuresthes tenuis TaxID=355514 RepID=UPI003B50408F
MTIELTVELQNSLSRIEMLEHENAVLEAKMSSTKVEMEELKRVRTNSLGVAFSLGLTNAGRLGPFNTDITLKFGKVFSNFGNSYNVNTGIFTAPVRVYYFRFSMWEVIERWMGVSLHHNDKKVMVNFNCGDSGHTTMSNAIILKLEQGDTVYMALLSGYSLYDDGNNYCTFNGFLLFPL